MDTEKVCGYFNDAKFSGIDVLTQSSQLNQNSILKFLKITKDLHSAQDLYVKSLAKVNNNLSSLLKEKEDPFVLFYEVLSATLDVFTNVQKDFSASISHIIKTLNISLDKTLNNQIKVFSSKDLSVIDDFKSSRNAVLKVKQKLSASDPPNKTEKSLEKLRSDVGKSLEKYRSHKDKFQDIMKEAAARAYALQVVYIDMMRKFMKGFGNSLAKYVFDLKEGVDSLKSFYKRNTTDVLLEKWLLSNMTVPQLSSTENGPFIDETIEFESPKIDTGEILVDLDTTSDSNNSNGANRLKKLFRSRKMSHNQLTISVNNNSNILDMDLSDLPQSKSRSRGSLTPTDDSSTQKKPGDLMSSGVEKPSNMTLYKTGKKKWPFTSNLKKYQSASDLPHAKDSLDDDCWQSRSNLHTEVQLDAEGYVIRPDEKDEKDGGSNNKNNNDSRTSNHSNDGHSSNDDSDSSDGCGAFQKIKVKIRPKANFDINSQSTHSELLDAANQIRLPQVSNTTGRPRNKVISMFNTATPDFGSLTAQKSFEDDKNGLSSSSTANHNGTTSDNTKEDKDTNVPKLRRSSRLVSERDKEILYRRSLSTTDLFGVRDKLVSLDADRSTQNDFENKTDPSAQTLSSKHYNIPIAVALTEFMSSESLHNSISISGQLSIALPLSLQKLTEDFFSLQSLSDLTVRVDSVSYPLSSFVVPNKSKEFITLSKLSKACCQVCLPRNKLVSLFNSTEGKSAIKDSDGNRYTLPVLEYSSKAMTQKDFQDSELLKCIGDFNLSGSTDNGSAEFVFNIGGKWVDLMQKERSILVKINLVSDGAIETIHTSIETPSSVSNGIGNPVAKRLNNLSWSLTVTNSDQIFRVVINNRCTSRIRVRLDYEFSLDNYSLLSPNVSLDPDTSKTNKHNNYFESNNFDYQLMLVHYRTISTGNMSQYFELTLI